MTVRKSHTMNQHTHVQLLFLFLFVILRVSRGYSADKNENSLSRFQITGQNMKGWAVEEVIKEFGPEELYDIINGGADVYVNKGLLKGMHQTVVKEGGHQCEIFVEDYGSPEKTKDIFAVTTETASDSLKLSTGDHQRIRIKEFLGGILVYMHHDNFYFEISLSGYTAAEKAVGDAECFVDFFEKILSGK